MSKRVLILTANTGIEEPELLEPVKFLKQHDIEVSHAAEKKDTVQTVKNDAEPASQVQPDLTWQDADPSQYDLLLIPGGTVNADQLRIAPEVQRIIQSFTDNGKPIAAICHAPWVLIDAERVRDKNLTSYKSIKLDLENAGGKWVDEEVHRCNTGDWPLITSRNPNDIPAFNNAILKELNG